MKLKMSLGDIKPLPDLSILWKAAYGSKAVALQRFWRENSIWISVSPVWMSSFASFFLVTIDISYVLDNILFTLKFILYIPNNE